MCDLGTCRPCRLEDLALDKAMGSTRTYIKPRLRNRDEIEAEARKVISTNPLEGVKRKSTPKPAAKKVVKPKPKAKKAPVTHIPKQPVGRSETQRSQARASKRKEERELINGRLVSINCPSHGTPSGYKAWWCRCSPCTVAFAEHRGSSPYRN